MKISPSSQIAALPEKRFLPLGLAALNFQPGSTANRKIFRGLKKNVESVWGTVGWADDTPFTPEGTIYFSESGNTDEGVNQYGEVHRLTRQEIDDLKEINPDLDVTETGQVRERYINFSELDFDLPEVFDPRNLPNLRLTVFLQPGEGALVYYQHSEKGNTSDEDAVFEYILNQGASPGRDRLDYIFPVEPKYKLVEVDEENQLYRQSDEETGTAFIIKILTFRQRKSTDQENFDRQIRTMNGFSRMEMRGLKSVAGNGELLYELVGKEKYNLLLFNPASSAQTPGGVFQPVRKPGQVKPDAKTLLLIHGTFVDTNTSFGELLKYDETLRSSFLQKLLLNNNFEQIIALDHPTISHDAEQNVKWLRDQMKALNIKLDKPLSILTSSRGALVAEYMASDDKLVPYIPEISKIMMFSAGNGCGYFTIGNRLSAVLSLWKKSAPEIAGKVILAIAQNSVDWFLDQPGCTMMNLERPALEKIMGKSPLNRNIRYMTVASDWHNCQNADIKWFGRLKNTSLDALIRIALGKQHDWVIGFERQQVIPLNSNTPQLQIRHSVHGRYFEKNYVKEQINGKCVLIPDPHKSIADFLS